MAKKVGYLCSKLDCRKFTIGSNSDGSGFIKLGTAAHITAASKGGPRYDPNLTRDQRKHESNGIWLCPDHGRLVDADDSHFTVQTLLNWKANAEKSSFVALAYALPRNGENAELVQLQPIPDDVEAITTQLIEAAKLDLDVFKNSLSWPEHSILLGLNLLDEDSSKPFDAANLVDVSRSFNEITVIAPPGSGKTTTLLQFSESMLGRNDCVSIYIPLSEWAVRQEDIFQSICRHRHFSTFNPDVLAVMAKHGRLTLVLDGWNELNASAKQAASLQIKELKRSYSDIRIILSTRQSDLDMPLAKWPIVKIDHLSEEQQKEIALSLREKEGEHILDHAWRTPGIRELISIPLYLTALILQASGETLPTTKEDILRMFVDNHEQDSEKAAELNKTFFGLHREILNALSAEATYKSTTALSESEARTISKGVIDGLIEQGQLASPIEPANALNAFVDLHTLVRSEEDSALSFQHQQFQEWYASFHVEALMLSAADGNTDDLKLLRECIIDQRIWEEPILFACERVSRTDERGINAIAFIILETLGIDPLLSAEMIYRSSGAVWEKVKSQVLEFVTGWHIPGQIDRAVSFMINTGRPDFFDLLWPLVSHENNQIHLSALRAGSRFRVSVLGDDIQTKLSQLDEELRKSIISEIAHHGDIQGMELATQIAINDPSPKVKFAIISGLLFRRGERCALEVLNNSPDEIWSELAKHNYADLISDPDSQTRLSDEIQKYTAEETDPHRRIRALNKLPSQSEDIAKEIESLLADMEPPASAEPHYRWTVDDEYKKYPDAVINALIKRLECDKEMPFMAENYLRSSSIVVDKGPIVDTLLSKEKTEQQARNIRISLAIVGLDTIGKIIDRLVGLSNKITEVGRPVSRNLIDEYHELKQWVYQTSDRSFIESLLGRPKAESANEISLLADLVSRHGDAHESKQFNLSDHTISNLTALMQSWAKDILNFEEAKRYELSEVASAMGRIASPQLTAAVQSLLDEDLARRQKAEEEFLEGLKKGQQIQNDARSFYYRRYMESLAAIADENAIELLKTYLPNQDCGNDAALALRDIWKSKQPPSSEDVRFRPSPDFTAAKDKRDLRIKGDIPEAGKFAEHILSVVSRIISSKPDKKARYHAFELATRSFTMPYGNKSEIIDALYNLPGDASEKIGILTALATAGEEINGDLVLQGIDAVFKAAEEEGKQWMLHEKGGYHIKKWMILLPFSDQPEALIGVFKQYREKDPHTSQPYHLTNVLSALSYSPHPESVNILKALAEIEPRFLTDHAWAHALIEQGTLAGAMAFFELTQSQGFSDYASHMNVVDMGNDLARLISKFPQLRQEVYKRYQGLDPSQSKAVSKRAIEESPDNEGVLILIRECAAEGRDIKHTDLYSAMRNLIVGERESQHWVGASELIGIPAQEFRKGIFEILTSGNENEVHLAKECLTIFDNIRDKYGVAETEPRHPDISSGIPWPQI